MKSVDRNADTNGDVVDLRRLILDVTRHQLVRQGYANLSMRKIAREIGYSATSIYLHFESKDALFHTLVEEGMDLLYEALVVAGSDDNPARRLHGICTAYVEFGRANPEYYEIMFVQRPERLDRYPPEKYRRARRSLDLIVATLRSGTANGTLSSDDPALDANALWAALHGIASLSLSGRIDVSVSHDAVARRMIDRLVEGMSRRPVALQGGC